MTLAQEPLPNRRALDALRSVRLAGARCAKSHEVVEPHAVRLALPATVPRVSAEQLRILTSAERETRHIAKSLRQHPCVILADQSVVPRALAVARAYLAEFGYRYDEETLAAFVDGYQEHHEMEMGEIWALRPSLQFALLEALEDPDANVDTILESLRAVNDADWKNWFESVSLPDRVLAKDPVYVGMDFASRDSYRKAISALAKHSPKSETEIAQIAIALSVSLDHSLQDPRALARRAHVGFYLLDDGLPMLQKSVSYRAPLMGRVRGLVLNNATGFYLIGIELLTIAIVVFLLSGLDSLTPIVAGLVLLVLPSTHAAVNFMNNLVTAIVAPKPLPKLDFSDGIPDDCATLIAVPSLLLNQKQVRSLVLDLEIRFLANRDRNLHFALVTDSTDSIQAVDEEDEPSALVRTCSDLIEGLNRRYSSANHVPFLLLHRHRVYNSAEGRWMGWERKRGKLLDLNQLLRGSFDSFPVKVGDTSVFPRIRYVITLDSDTQLPRDTARRLVATMAHPLNQAVVDAESRVVIEGYGILQPRIGISIESASRSRLAALYSGQTGFDIYTRAVSDVYQDLFGEGSFTGKGIYEVDVFRDALQQRFPENALLSHDLLEGAYARAGLVSDIELVDDYPSHFSAYSRRKHRWVRGDWQIMRWLLAWVPDYHGRIISNPISLISRWKIVDNLRRSLIEPATLVLFVAGWLYLPGNPVFWTLASVLMLFLPVWANLLFLPLRVPWRQPGFGAWARDFAGGFLKENVVTALALVFLLHQSLLSIDAIGRSVMRVFVTKKRLLEWETAAEAESAVRHKSTVDAYLDRSPVLSIGLAVLLWFLRPDSFPVACPILAAWTLAPALSAWLNRAPRTHDKRIAAADVRFLREEAEKIWRYFRDWSSPATNWLVPDHIREDGFVDLRLSPTNAGLLLNARIAALELGLIELEDFIAETQQTLSALMRLQKYRGHLFNWYDIETLEPLEPRFISTVDSGNLVACLWTLRQVAVTFAEKSNTAADARVELQAIGRTCDRLVQSMDFRFLYHPRKKVLSVGFDLSSNQLQSACYDLLASESRIASFIAIAKGDIPQEAWFHLGRAHTLCDGRRVLLSWTGTMFEYLMPMLWMRHHQGTITDESTRAAVESQRSLGSRRGIPWGVSESGYVHAEGEYGYAPFGLSTLALRAAMPQKLVISPYASFLALEVEPIAAVRNLREMDLLGWSGKYGLYEAADYADGVPTLVRSWMAHHLGMSLLAITNLLCGEPIRRYFHAVPEVMATELLLHERVPKTVVPEPEVDVAEVSSALPMTMAAG